MNHHHHNNALPASAGIPLHCNICPKKPDFSDVSHLLTHIGSKSHLSNHYKMKVKASSDLTSRRIIAEYDEWYDMWNVEDMMSDRLDQKEKKKSGVPRNNGSTSRRTSAANSVASSRRSTPLATNLAARRSQALRESTLDPQLGVRIKQEPRSRSATPASGFMYDAAVQNRSFAPPMLGWGASPYQPTPIRQERSVLDSVYSTPSSASEETEVPDQHSWLPQGRSLSGSNHSLPLNDDTEEVLNDGLNDSTRLKGVIWPGMKLFDSATPKMRRKRNQKKDESVIEQLQLTSETVEATEQVFDAEGELRRERPITGNPEEEDGQSPLPGEATPPPELRSPSKKKKPGRKPRVALKERNVNTNRVTRRSQYLTTGRSSRATPYFHDVDDDDELTYERRGPRKRSGLSIHRDNSGPDITFNHPASMSTLTSGFRHPFHTGPPQNRNHLPYQNGAHHPGHQRLPSLGYAQGFRAPATNPLGLPPPNLGSFGQLSGHSIFHNNPFQNNNSFPFANGQQAFEAFQQQFGLRPQSFPNDNSTFQAPVQGQGAVQNSQPWDVFGGFGFGQTDFGVPNLAEVNFNVNGDFGTANPLFMSSNQGAAEDDEATISPPSDR